MRNLFVHMILASAKDAKGGSGAAEAPKGKDTPAPPPPSQAGTASAPQTEIENEGVEMLRKLSPATIIGQFKKPKKQDGVNADGSAKMVAYGEEEIWPETALYIVMGVTHGTRTGTGDNGPWVAFLGAFEAIRIKDGKRFQGGQCFVPKAVEDMMVATLNATRKAQAESGTAGAIEFGIEVGVKHSLTQMGYEYYVKNLVKTQGTDPLAALRAKIRPALPLALQAALPAPALTAPAIGPR